MLRASRIKHVWRGKAELRPPARLDMGSWAGGDELVMGAAAAGERVAACRRVSETVLDLVAQASTLLFYIPSGAVLRNTSSRGAKSSEGIRSNLTVHRPVSNTCRDCGLQDLEFSMPGAEGWGTLSSKVLLCCLSFSYMGQPVA